VHSFQFIYLVNILLGLLEVNIILLKFSG